MGWNCDSPSINADQQFANWCTFLSAPHSLTAPIVSSSFGVNAVSEWFSVLVVLLSSRWVVISTSRNHQLRNDVFSVQTVENNSFRNVLPVCCG